MNIEESLAGYLETVVAGLVYGSASESPTLFLGELPASPDEAVAVVGTGGPTSDTKLGYDTPSVQIISRGTVGDRTGGYSVAEDVYNALHGLTSTTLPDGTRLILCQAVQSRPVNMGPDENGRYRFSLNFELEVRNLTTNRE